MRLYIKADTDYSLAFNGSVEDRVQIASTTEDIDLLEIYAYDPSEEVRTAVAQNPDTPAGVLNDMVVAVDTNRCYDLREAVLENSNISSYTLLWYVANDYFYKDRAVELIWQRIENGHIDEFYQVPEDLKEDVIFTSFLSGAVDIFAKDPNPEIRRYVASSDHVTAEALADLADDPDWLVRIRVAENKNTSAATLKRLAKDPKYSVRKGVVENENTLYDVLNILVNDEDDDIRERAQVRLIRLRGESV